VPVQFRIKCCLCRRNIPLAQDVYELDAEWQRRFPRIVGTLACDRCALRTPWTCQNPDGTYVGGHIPTAKIRCVDAWSHILGNGTHRAMVMTNPRSALLQGAEPYLRSIATRPGVNPQIAASVRALLQDWAPSAPPRVAGSTQPCDVAATGRCAVPGSSPKRLLDQRGDTTQPSA
jgi:hypothetical protein